MTSTNSLSKEQKYKSGKYYGFRIRSTWNILLIFIIITLVVMVIPSVLNSAMLRSRILEECAAMTPEEIAQKYAESTVSDEMATSGSALINGMVLSFAFAIVSGMSCLSFLNNKKGVGCFHSFPMKRETLFFTDTTIFLIYYVISNIVGFSLIYLIRAAFIPYVPISNDVFFTFALASLILFLVIYSTIIFAGSLTGTGFMKILLGAVFAVVGIIGAFSLLMMFFYGCNNLNLGYYFVENQFILDISPAVRLIKNLTLHLSGTKSIYSLLWALPDAAVFYVAALFLYKIRKSEKTGTTIIWKPAFYITKYLLMFISAMIGGMSFGIQRLFISYDESALTSDIWFLVFLIAGALISSFITYIICNAILFKSTKSMFMDIFPGFTVFCAAVIVFILLVPYNITGLIGKPYSANNTKSIDVQISGCTLTFDEKEFAQFLVPALEDDAKERQSELYKLGRESWEYDGSSTVSLTVTQHPKFGVALSKEVRVDTDEIASEITRTEKFAETVNSLGGHDASDLDYVSMSLLTDKYISADIGSFPSSVKETVFDSLKYDLDSRRNYPLLAMVNVCFDNNDDVGYGYYSRFVPIYADNIELINTISPLTEEPIDSIMSTADYYEYYAESMKGFELVNLETSEIKKLSTDEFIALAQYTANLDELSSESRMYTDISDVHYAVIATYDADVAYGKESYDDLSTEWYPEDECYMIYFRDGAITNSELEKIFNSID